MEGGLEEHLGLQHPRETFGGVEDIEEMLTEEQFNGNMVKEENFTPTEDLEVSLSSERIASSIGRSFELSPNVMHQKAPGRFRVASFGRPLPTSSTLPVFPTTLPPSTFKSRSRSRLRFRIEVKDEKRKDEMKKEDVKQHEEIIKEKEQKTEIERKEKDIKKMRIEKEVMEKERKRKQRERRERDVKEKDRKERERREREVMEKDRKERERGEKDVKEKERRKKETLKCERRQDATERVRKLAEIREREIRERKERDRDEEEIREKVKKFKRETELRIEKEVESLKEVAKPPPTISLPPLLASIFTAPPHLLSTTCPLPSTTCPLPSTTCPLPSTPSTVTCPQKQTSHLASTVLQVKGKETTLKDQQQVEEQEERVRKLAVQAKSLQLYNINFPLTSSVPPTYGMAMLYSCSVCEHHCTRVLHPLAWFEHRGTLEHKVAYLEACARLGVNKVRDATFSPLIVPHLVSRCEECGIQFSSKWLLLQHTEVNHRDFFISHEAEVVSESRGTSGNICQFFKSGAYNSCAYGKWCRNLHMVPVPKTLL